MKVVNADDLKKEISKAPVWTALAVKEMIDEMTIDLVRCKECRWAYPRQGYGETGVRCVFHRFDKGDDWFCADGERREP